MPHDDLTEQFYLVDEHDQVIGAVSRQEAHADRTKIHRAVDILLFDDDKLLMQKRSAHKDLFPEYWTISASGHLTYGDTYEEAAKRELQEELGIEAELTFIGKLLTDTGVEQEFQAMYRAEYAGQKIDFDQTEVSEVAWVPVDQLADFVDEYDITPNGMFTLQAVGLIK